MKRINIFLTILSVMIFLCFNTMVFSKPGKPKDIKIEIHNGKMTANIKNAALIYVLDDIQKKTGIKYDVAGGELGRNISVHFKSLPMAEAFERILDEFKHVLIFGSNGNITEVNILGIDKTKSSRNEVVHKEDVSDTSGKDGMKITPTLKNEEMVIEPPEQGVAMEILPPSIDEEMIIEPTS